MALTDLSLKDQRAYWQSVKDHATTMLQELDLEKAVEDRGKSVDLTDRIAAIEVATPTVAAYTDMVAERDRAALEAPVAEPVLEEGVAP
jgi:hypothetical protein